MPYQKYPQNIEYYLYKYKFFDVKPNTIKDGQILSPYPQFLHTGFEFKNDIYKHFSLKRVDEYVFENPLLLQLWSKEDIYTYRVHSWPVMKKEGFAEFKNQIFCKCFIKEDIPEILISPMVMVKN